MPIRLPNRPDVTRVRLWPVAAGVAVLVVILGAVLRNQANVYRGSEPLTAEEQQRREAGKQRRALVKQRYALFDMLQPVALANCRLERFGEPHDGGYLMCGNLLDGIQAGYSYGISGYDKWGCDISTKLDVTVHQYDCFDTTRPACPGGRTVFHAECVGGTPRTVEGRVFDTIENQFAKNGDRSRRIVLKIDVEGAEWDSFLSAPDGIFEQIDQMAVEFHWFRDADLQWTPKEKHVRALQRLKQFFEIGHLHFNNAACAEGLEPFPTWAYEVLFVSKRLALVDPSGKAGGLHPRDAPNEPRFADCQPAGR